VFKKHLNKCGTLENGNESRNSVIRKAAQDFLRESIKEKYSYNFSWMGRRIIQYPQDLVAVQEIVWDVKPDLIIETGVAHGGSAVFFASLLELNAQCGGPKDAEVWCVEIELRAHNREAVVAHPLYPRLRIFDGSSIDSKIASIIGEKAANCERVMVVLDSNHTHEHVLGELNLYAPLVSVGSYCVVFDTVIEDLDGVEFVDRPWGKGNNPKTAVAEFLKKNSDFEVNSAIDEKLLISAAPGGYLKRVR
jgi:cephalosporin hydroxylase